MMKVCSTLLLMFLPVVSPTPVLVVQHATTTSPTLPSSCTTTTTSSSTTTAPAAAAFVHGSSSTGNGILSSSTLMSSTAAVFTTVPRGGDAEGKGEEEGRLHHPETTDDVEALIVKAAMMNQLVVIDFTASWCGPCKMIAPLFQEMAEEMGDDVVFIKVDVDEHPETAAKYSVSAMPTFLFLKQGQVIDRLMGANASRLQELIQEHM